MNHAFSKVFGKKDRWIETPFQERATRVKQVIAIVKPYLAEQVLETLSHAPVEALSVREVKGYGRQKSYLDQYSDSEYSESFLYPALNKERAARDCEGKYK